MEAHLSDRVGPIPRSRLPTLVFLAFALLTLTLVVGIAAFGWTLDTLRGELRALGLMKRPDFAAVYAHLNVPPLDPSMEAGAAAPFAKLAREPCDGPAVMALARGVEEGGEQRWAAEALTGWGGACGPDNAGALRQATSLYINLHAYDRAFALARDLVAAHPHVADYQYLKGKAEVGLRRVDDALLSFANTIHLEPAPLRVGSWVFTDMSDLYASTGRYCEAIGPIQDYVSLDPATRDTAPMQKLMTDDAAKGHCAAFAAGADRFPVAGANVIRTRVLVNGVAGTFILDTGASFVTVTAAFARKAHLDASGSAPLRAMTANGAVYDRLVPAGSVRVGRVEARQVPVAIQESGMGAVDGLLGRSFLSRFDVAIEGEHWSLRSKTGDKTGDKTGAKP